MRRLRHHRASGGLVAVPVGVALATAACGGSGLAVPAVATPPAVASMAASAPTVPTPDRPFGPRTKDTSCAAHDGVPDVACTPGAVFPDVTAAQICTPGYSSSVRNVPSEVSRAVYAEYGILERSPGQFEVDHLVPLEAGGSNDVANLWPEAAEPRPGFHEKDQVENYLHDQVCTGGMSLADAQRAIATNWLDVYHELPQRAPAGVTTLPYARTVGERDRPCPRARAQTGEWHLLAV